MTDDAELHRLRELVGPSELTYRQLGDDVAAATETARVAMVEAGELRGRLAEMSVQLARARQDQDTLQRRREFGPLTYLGDLGREYWVEVVRPRVARRVRWARGRLRGR